MGLHQNSHLLFPTFLFDWGASSQFSFLLFDWQLLQADFGIINKPVNSNTFSIPTTTNMSMSPIHSVHAYEPSEIEEIVKVEVDEKHLPPLQYVYKTDETLDEDPSDEEEAFR